MWYLYTICGIQLSCQIPFELHIQGESKEFLQPVEEKPQADLYMIFRQSEILPLSLKQIEKGHWVFDRLYIEREKEQQIYYCPIRRLPPYACVTWPRDEGKIIYCDYVKGAELYMNYSHNLCDLIGIENLLTKQKALLLHASLIRWKGKAILFSAPTGTGKSTQADLWVKYEGAEILNGDRAGLRRLNNQWEAYGLPIAGSSMVYRNEAAPVKGIIVLRQALQNKMHLLHPAEAFGYLYSEVTVHQWNRLFVERVTDLLTSLLKEIPVYLLECRPDEAAVFIVKRVLFGEDRDVEG